MIVTTTDEIPDKKIREILGIVAGETVRARGFGKDLTQGLRNIAGGELKAYTELMAAGRTEALQRAITEAEKLKADAIISLRFVASEITQGAAEVLASGTAVKLQY